jgi:hydrogenase maturation protease
MKPLLVVGLGTPERRDDGVGLVVVEALRAVAPATVAIHLLPRQALELLTLWEDHRHVWVVDAVHSGALPGTCHRLQPAAQHWPAHWQGGSTHGLGLAEGIALAESLGVLPTHLVVYGVEGADFGLGEGLSPEVAAAVPQVVARLQVELEEVMTCTNQA